MDGWVRKLWYGLHQAILLSHRLLLVVVVVVVVDLRGTVRQVWCGVKGVKRKEVVVVECRYFRLGYRLVL